MKYIWIIMLVIADLIWIIASISDVVYAIKDKRWIDPIAKACAWTHLAMLFLVSFLMWLFS